MLGIVIVQSHQEFRFGHTFCTEANMLIKTLYFKKVQDFGGGVIRPSVIETDSPLYKGYKSIMIFAKIKGRQLPDEAFTLNFLPRVGRLR